MPPALADGFLTSGPPREIPGAVLGDKCCSSLPLKGEGWGVYLYVALSRLKAERPFRMAQLRGRLEEQRDL